MSRDRGAVATDEAVVLQARPWRESSRLLECLTRTGGRQGLIHHGVRDAGRSGARRRGTTGVLQPFIHYEVTLTGGGELRTVRSAESLTRCELVGEHLFGGMYVNELVRLLTHRFAPAPQLFDGVLMTFSLLQSQLPLEPVLRAFEIALLDELGVGIDLQHALDGSAIRDGRTYVDLPDRGLMALDSGAPLPSESTGFRFAGAHLLAIARREFDDVATVRAARRLLRPRIDLLLDGRALRTRELFRQRPGGADAAGRADAATAAPSGTVPDDGASGS